MPDCPHRPWPGSEAYAYLRSVQRADLAWEWLRRDPAYRQLAPSLRRRTADGLIVEAAPMPVIARWGCLHIEDASLPATETMVMWSAALDQSVLRVAAHPTPTLNWPTFDLRRWAGRATIVIDCAGEHILLHGRPAVRLDVIAGTLLNGPAMLHYDLSASSDLERTIRSLRHFIHLCRAGHSVAPSPGNDRVTLRSIDALRVRDALARGASIRDIGLMLFGEARVHAEWHASGESLKSRCRRLIALARFMAAGGYKTLLC